MMSIRQTTLGEFGGSSTMDINRDAPAPGGQLVELSIVMPCLNEQETVAVCVRKAIASLREAGIAGEVIVADNGSTDDSVLLAEAEGARV